MTVKFYAIELPVYLALLWYLVGRMGIVGAALAWTFRVVIDATLLFAATTRLRIIPFRSLVENGLIRSAAGVGGFAAGLLAVCWVVPGLAGQLIVAGVLASLFVIVTWVHVLDHGDRGFLTAALGHLRAPLGRADGRR